MGLEKEKRIKEEEEEEEEEPRAKSVESSLRAFCSVTHTHTLPIPRRVAY